MVGSLENPFKVGDWVRCINPGPNEFIKKGMEYLVTRVSTLVDWSDRKITKPAIGLEGTQSNFFSFRFELMEPPKPPEPWWEK